MGKIISLIQQGSNTAINSTTPIANIIGVEKSFERAYELRDLALAELVHLPDNTDTLAWLAAYAVDRDR